MSGVAAVIMIVVSLSMGEAPVVSLPVVVPSLVVVPLPFELPVPVVCDDGPLPAAEQPASASERAVRAGASAESEWWDNAKSPGEGRRRRDLR